MKWKGMDKRHSKSTVDDDVAECLRGTMEEGQCNISTCAQFQWTCHVKSY